MSSCLNGGANFELEMMKSSHNTPSPSSTISESNSPPLAISTRKPRTKRKRPNQKYDEAAVLLSTAYPNVFFSNRKTQFNPLFESFLSDYNEASQLILPFEGSDSLFNPMIQTKIDNFSEHKEVNFRYEVNDSEVDRFGKIEDFDVESILDEEIEEGIDSFMGNIKSNEGENRGNGESGFSGRNLRSSIRFGLRSSLRENYDSNYWNFPTVEFEQISPTIFQTATTAVADDSQSNAAVGDKKKKKKNKKKKVGPEAAAESKSSKDPYLNSKPEQRVSALLKLDFDGVLKAWSDKASPFADDASEIDVHARLGAIDLFGEIGMRKTSVLRYKEKRKNRIFSNSKTIRYQVRKLSADDRPRMKGRFVRMSNIRKLSGLRS